MTGPIPVAGWVLIAHVAGMFVHSAAARWMRTPIDEWTAFSWDTLRAGRVWTALTYPLVESVETIGLGWLFGIALVWFLGRFLEDRLGRARLAQMTVVAVVAGAAVFAAAWSVGVGAQIGSPVCYGLGPISTAWVVYCALAAPHHPVNVWFVTVPMWLFAAVFVAFDVFAVTGLAVGGSGVTVWANVGAGLWAAAAWRWDLAPDVGAWMARRRAESARRRAAAAQADDASMRDRVDELLAKIHRDGIQSLTKEERDFLNRSSKRY